MAALALLEAILFALESLPRWMDNGGILLELQRSVGKVSFLVGFRTERALDITLYR